MGKLTYRNCFLAFAALYLPAWSMGGWFGSDRSPSVNINGEMGGMETAVSAVIFVLVLIITISVILGLAWAVVKALTGYSMTAWEIILYLFMVGWVTFATVGLLLSLVFSVPFSFIDFDQGQKISAFEGNIATVISIAITGLVAAWSSGIFFQQVNKKLAAGEQQDSK